MSQTKCRPQLGSCPAPRDKLPQWNCQVHLPTGHVTVSSSNGLPVMKGHTATNWIHTPRLKRSTPRWLTCHHLSHPMEDAQQDRRWWDLGTWSFQCSRTETSNGFCPGLDILRQEIFTQRVSVWPVSCLMETLLNPTSQVGYAACETNVRRRCLNERSTRNIIFITAGPVSPDWNFK